MTLIAVGINHKTAPVVLREKVAFPVESMVEALASLREHLGAEESVILSTCNRTEIYISTEHSLGDKLIKWLANFHNLDTNELICHSYLLEEQEAIQHILRVASGLDSLVLGEPQILGQVKQAYTSAKNYGAVNSQLEKLFQHTFSVAKKVRTETDIGANAVSVAFAAVQLSKQIFSSLSKTKVLLIGAGETIELVAKHLTNNGVNKITVANRTLSRGKELAEQINANVITLAQIPNVLHEADIVISSTASTLPIIGKGMVESALKDRKHKPIFFVDLAVPRDIETEVADLDDAYLYSVDDLQHIVEQNLASRQQAADEAELIIREQAQVYFNWQNSLESIDSLKLFRQQNNDVKVKLQQRALSQLAEGKDPQEVVIELSNKLTNALLHAPTKALSRAASEQDQDTLSLLRQTLGLDVEKEQTGKS
ncbi:MULTISPECIES: glutamyl-tRNA reductase [Alteromonadaceae]|uniref:glutamyl-tRNA reductase n=1 Tax=Alteromonadaceae TaxID=72275 RepID=UPI001C0873F8|nr:MULTISPECIES: glutamyl-tRNA reductase [Aliiglaciecola]MBU2880034.1 glutamyl-tRNA reductase [Aliiglaciecola lipolytica]MDO6710968.1 glutamyl-tRNA reductase [Aliiglaciecola sp. 2_MG-2023]MDO6752449.1 glutamyl-tRNA reductase [Aliiglaciecola sp. 1_MG-2023]